MPITMSFPYAVISSYRSKQLLGLMLGLLMGVASTVAARVEAASCRRDCLLFDGASGSQSPQLAQNVSVETGLAQMNHLMNAGYQDLLPFLQILSQLEQAQTDEQLLAIVQRVKPLAVRMNQNFSQGYQVGQRAIAQLPADRVETQYMNTIVILSGVGAETFSPWVDLLTAIEQAYASQNSDQLLRALQQLPASAQKIEQFASATQSVIAQGQQLNQKLQASTDTGSSGNTQSMSPSQVRMMMQMRQRMHETNMNIIRNIGSDGGWRYNYSTGQGEYY